MTQRIDPGATLKQQIAQAAILLEKAKRTRKWVDFTVGDRFCRIGYTLRGGDGPHWPVHCDPDSVDSRIRGVWPWREEWGPEHKYVDSAQRQLLEMVGLLPWPIKLLSVEINSVEITRTK